MPYMLQPKNQAQTFRPNLYNVAYRRVGAYKGMGRLHPSNYLEIGVRPNRIGETSGQYNTLGGQLSLLPPSLRGLGQGSTYQIIGPPADPAQAVLLQMNQLAASGGAYPNIPADVGTGANIINPATGQVLPGVFTSSSVPTNIPTNTWLYVAIGALFLVLLTGGRR